MAKSTEELAGRLESINQFAKDMDTELVELENLNGVNNSLAYHRRKNSIAYLLKCCTAIRRLSE